MPINVSLPWPFWFSFDLHDAPAKLQNAESNLETLLASPTEEPVVLAWTCSFIYF
jgi:hypothetical protein